MLSARRRRPFRSPVGTLVAALLLGGCDRSDISGGRGGGEVVRIASDSASAVVEFAGSNAVILPVHVNGVGPLRFALDTGSTLTCVDQALAARMGLPEEGGRQGVTAGAAGVGRVRVVRLDSVRVGAAMMRSLPACVVDLGHARQVGVEIEGLIGLNFLRAFRVSIDFGQRTVVLEEP